MIVINSKPGIVSLPYRPNPKDKTNVKVFSFMPGKNSIDKDTWQKVKLEAGDTLDNHPLEVFSEDDKIDVPKLNAKDMINLIENTIELSELDAYLDAENKSEKPRVTVVEAIEKQKKSIDAFDTKLEEERNKNK